MATPRVSTKVGEISLTFGDLFVTSPYPAVALQPQFRGDPYLTFANGNVNTTSNQQVDAAYFGFTWRNYFGVTRGSLVPRPSNQPLGSALVGEKYYVFLPTSSDPFSSTTYNVSVLPLGQKSVVLPIDSFPVNYTFDYTTIPGLLTQNSLTLPVYDTTRDNAGFLYSWVSGIRAAVFTDTAVTFKEAFPITLPDEDLAYTSLAGTDANYTFLSDFPGTPNPNCVLVRWLPVDVGETPDFEKFDITLNDTTDNDLFTALYDDSAYSVVPNANGNEFIFSYRTFATDELNTAFIFNQDMTEYTRVNITFTGTGIPQVLFKNVDGEYLLTSLEDDNTLTIYAPTNAPYAPVDEAPEVEPAAEDTASPVIRSWGFTLDSHEIYVNRIGGQSPLLFDAKTGQWSRWASNGRPVWRAHQGFNWLGMSSTNYAAGATSNVVCGDDASGILWTLEPDAGSDDTGLLPVEQELFPRRVIGGVPARSRQASRNSLVSMTVDVGDPVDSDIGSQIRLELSDDYGKTWQDCGVVEIPAGSFGKEVMWRSLGLVRQPGRLYRFTDFGATTRIDGVDVIIDPGDGR